MPRQRARFDKFTIDVPQSESEPFIHINVQLVTHGGDDIESPIVKVSGRADLLHFTLSELIADPEIQMLAYLVQKKSAEKMAEEYGATVDENGFVWIDE